MDFRLVPRTTMTSVHPKKHTNVNTDGQVPRFSHVDFRPASWWLGSRIQIILVWLIRFFCFPEVGRKHADPDTAGSLHSGIVNLRFTDLQKRTMLSRQYVNRDLQRWVVPIRWWTNGGGLPDWLSIWGVRVKVYYTSRGSIFQLLVSLVALNLKRMWLQ